MYWENYAFSNCLDTVLTCLVDGKFQTNTKETPLPDRKGPAGPTVAAMDFELPDDTHLYGGVGGTGGGVGPSVLCALAVRFSCPGLTPQPAPTGSPHAVRVQILAPRLRLFSSGINTAGPAN
jgi:hypothetical protein